MDESSTSWPKVSVICLCYNQAAYVQESIQSVFNQTHGSVEVIVVNDASTDSSAEIIKKITQKHPEVTFLDLPHNVGNCQAFNQGLREATGKYVIDLSCDDVLTTDRIERQVEAFEKLSESYGVLYSNATYINESGDLLGDHFSRYPPESGDLYEALVRRYFIAPPTMMIRKSVFDELGGYDEALAYEDFDFWVRSARNWKYDYLKEPLTLIRKTRGSLSSKFHQKDNTLIRSTLEVCKKIKSLNRSVSENTALVHRLKYELKLACLTGSRTTAKGYYAQMSTITSPDWISKFWLQFSRLRWNVYPLINWIRRQGTRTR